MAHTPVPSPQPTPTNRHCLSLDLIEALPAEEVQRRLLSGLRAGDLGERVSAFYLAELDDRAIYQELGYPNLKAYARDCLPRPYSSVMELVRVGRALRDLPDLGEALALGKLNWSAVRAISRVATPETERRWVVWADGRSVREVERHVARREKGELPTDPGKRRIHTTKVDLGVRLDSKQALVWEVLRDAVSERFGATASNTDLALWLAHKALAEWTGDRAALRPDPSLDPRNHGPEVPQGERHPPAGKKLREEVHVRDGGRCASCGGRENLSAHHIWWRRYGGPTTHENLITFCEGCHSLVHDRLLILRGDANQLEFLDRDGELRGERRAPQPVTFQADAESRRRDQPAEPARVPVTFNDVPSSADMDWWHRHRHLFRFVGRDGSLEFAHGSAPTERPPRRKSDGAEPSLSPGGGLEGLIGLEQARASLGVAVRAALATGDQLPHVLLMGPPGLGKSSLARAIAHDLGQPYQGALAPVGQDLGALTRQLLSLEPRQVLFLDEIHRVSPRAAEVLYGALECGRLDLSVRCGTLQRQLSVRLEPFTLIGATTEEGALPAPFLSRFVYRVRLDYYGPGDMGQILERAALRWGLSLTPEARDLLTRASRDTPRDGLALLQAVRDGARVGDPAPPAEDEREVSTSRLDAGEPIDATQVRAALSRSGIGPGGILPGEARCLEVLGQAGRPLGLTSLAAAVGTSRKNLRLVLEPYLLRRGLIEVSPRGRSLTDRGRKLLERLRASEPKRRRAA